MIEIIFTYRPIQIKKPISWINLITRWISKAPYDHIAVKRGRWVYESSAGTGVHRIKYKDWRVGREGTTVQIHEAPDDDFNLDYFELLDGKPYDYRSAFLHAFKAHKLMRKRSLDAFTCSEFVGFLMDHPEYYRLLPVDIKKICNERDYELYEEVI